MCSVCSMYVSLPCFWAFGAPTKDDWQVWFDNFENNLVLFDHFLANKCARLTKRRTTPLNLKRRAFHPWIYFWCYDIKQSFPNFGVYLELITKFLYVIWVCTMSRGCLACFNFQKYQNKQNFLVWPSEVFAYLKFCSPKKA